MPVAVKLRAFDLGAAKSRTISRSLGSTISPNRAAKVAAVEVGGGTEAAAASSGAMVSGDTAGKGEMHLCGGDKAGKG